MIRECQCGSFTMRSYKEKETVMSRAILDLIDRVYDSLLVRHLKATGVLVVLVLICASITNVYYATSDQVVHGSLGSSPWFYVIGVGIVAVVGWIVLLYCVHSGQPPLEEEKPKRPDEFQIILFVFWPLILVFCIGSFLFVDGQSERWIVDGKIGTQRSVFVLPYFSDIRKLSNSQNVNVEVTATTKDGIRIRAQIYAELKLSNNEETVLQIAQRWAHPNNQLHTEVVRELQKRFREVALRYDLKDVESLTVDWEMGNAISEPFLQSFGLEWAGTLSVAHVRVWFSKDV